MQKDEDLQTLDSTLTYTPHLSHAHSHILAASNGHSHRYNILQGAYGATKSTRSWTWECVHKTLAEQNQHNPDIKSHAPDQVNHC